MLFFLLVHSCQWWQPHPAPGLPGPACLRPRGEGQAAGSLGSSLGALLGLGRSTKRPGWTKWLVLLAWEEGKGSRAQDHPRSHCPPQGCLPGWSCRARWGQSQEAWILVPGPCSLAREPGAGVRPVWASLASAGGGFGGYGTTVAALPQTDVQLSTWGHPVAPV